MANEKQFKWNTRFIATRGVSEYRETIPYVLQSDDVVLELGCEWGPTTALLAEHCSEVIGTDVSPNCIRRARQLYPELRFEVLDAFDVRAALEMGTNIYMDLSGFSGYRSLLDVLALLTMYATVLRPQAIVVKSGALKHLARHCFAWTPPASSE